MKQQRVARGIIKKISPQFGIQPSNLSGILNGHRGISRKRAIKFSKICASIGYDISPEDWMFNPEKIKNVFNKETA